MALNFGPNEGKRWNELFSEIDKGNVIPVIGPDLLVNPKVVEENEQVLYKENLHQQIISHIAKECEVTSHPRTFSQLIHDREYKYHAGNDPANSIYYCLDDLLSRLPDNNIVIESSPSEQLVRLLKTRKFPFVITTSFTFVVEKAMEQIWGKGRVQPLIFNNDPSESMREGFGDIKSVNDMKSPIVYYMFGKCCDKPRHYVVTDSDMMNFCGSWIKGAGVPRKLAEVLKTKQLLILGNNYSDWLFRFVWYCLRNTGNDMKSDTMLKMRSDTVVKESAEQSFVEFIEHLNIFFQKNPSEVIERISKHYENVSTSEDKYTNDVFISYSRSDRQLARNLTDSLTAKGCRVWFDNDSIQGAKDWKSSIEEGIKSSRLFVPILSKNVANEYMEEHEYRNEWDLAKGKSKIIGGITYIIPFAEQGFDFYDRKSNVPDEFQKKNAIWYSHESDVEEITNIILQELEELKKQESDIYKNDAI